jgi:hypothetical protein
MLNIKDAITATQDLLFSGDCTILMNGNMEADNRGLLEGI